MKQDVIFLIFFFSKTMELYFRNIDRLTPPSRFVIIIHQVHGSLPRARARARDTNRTLATDKTIIITFKLYTYRAFYALFCEFFHTYFSLSLSLSLSLSISLSITLLNILCIYIITHLLIASLAHSLFLAQRTHSHSGNNYIFITRL